MRVIFHNVPMDDMILAMRAVRWLSERDHKDSILSYGEGDATKDFYVRRTVSGFSVRPTFSAIGIRDAEG